MYELGEIKGILQGVHSEAKKTNGRVTRLEGEIAKLQTSDSVQNTKLGLIGSVAGAMGGLLVKFFLR